MTRDDARLLRLLEGERTKLLADLAYFDQVEYTDIGSSNHLADDGTAAYDQASDLALYRQAQHRLNRINRALEKFSSGYYGYCENCGDAIDFARLKALPDARFCLDCQRKREVSGSTAPGPKAFEQGKINGNGAKDGRF